MNLLRLFSLTLALALIGVCAEAASTGSVRAFKIKGNVTLKNDETGKVTPLMLGKAFGQGYSVVTGKKSSVLLVFSNGSTINLDEKSSLSVSKFLQEKFDQTKGTYLDLNADPSVSETQLQLNYGELAFNVKKLSKGSVFNVNTEVGSAGIRGTKGSVQVVKNAAGKMTIKVTNKSGTVVWLKMENGKLVSDNQGQQVGNGKTLTGTLGNEGGNTDGALTSGNTPQSELQKIENAVENIDIPDEVKNYIEAVLVLENAQETGGDVAAAEKALKDAVEAMGSSDNVDPTIAVVGVGNDDGSPDLVFDTDVDATTESSTIVDVLNNQTSTTTDTDDAALIYLTF